MSKAMLAIPGMVTLLMLLHTSPNPVAGVKWDSPRPESTAVSKEYAERIARDGTLAYLERSGIRCPHLRVGAVHLVKSLSQSVNDSWLVLFSCTPEEGQSFFGEVLIDQVSGSTILYKTIPEGEYNSYYHERWLLHSLSAIKHDMTELRRWTLVDVDSGAAGYRIKIVQLMQHKIGLGEGMPRPVWLVTNSRGMDFFVSMEGWVSEVFGLDKQVKQRLGHPLFPEVKAVVTRERAETIAKNSVAAHFHKYDIPCESLMVGGAYKVRRLWKDKNDLWVVLISCTGKRAQPFFGEVIIDCVTGSIYPYSVRLDPIHPVPEQEYRSYYNEEWLLSVLAGQRAQIPEPRHWSLVGVTSNTPGYSIGTLKGTPQEIGINSGWGIPVWLVTDAGGRDFFVTTEGNVHEIFELDSEIKNRIGHGNGAQAK